MIRKISFQLFSDLHLELIKSNAIPKITPLSDNLILAGDICKLSYPSLLEFLSYCNENWKKTYYVFGNHEYWDNKSFLQKSIIDIKQQIHKHNLTNVQILDNKCVSINDEVNICGSTFWTNISPNNYCDAVSYFGDYSNINFTSSLDEISVRKLKPVDVNNMYREGFSFLRNTIQETADKGKKLIIVTHFPPQRTNTSHKMYRVQDDVSKEYFSHPDGTIEKLGNCSNVLCWISGHTHYSYDIKSRENVRLISNQCGYRGELKYTNFNSDGLFEVEY